MFQLYTVFLGISLVSAVPISYYGEASLDENGKSFTSDELIDRLESDHFLWRAAKDNNVYPKIHEVIELPQTGNDYVLFEYPPSDVEQRESMSVNHDLEHVYYPNIWSDQNVRFDRENSDQVMDGDKALNKMLMDITDNYDDTENMSPNHVKLFDASPRIHSTIPILEAFNNYDDIFNTKHTKYRPAGTEIDDIMSELTHDAVMKNILPTMSFGRDVDEYPMYLAFNSNVYPNSASDDCSLPLQMGCNPYLYHGYLSSLYPQPITPAPVDSAHRGDIGFFDDRTS